MTAGAEFRFEPLGRLHNRAVFSCGEPQLDNYLRRFARQDRDRHLAAVFVLADEAGSIAAYYTLSASVVVRASLPSGSVAGPYEAIPATLIGRLAVDQRFQGRRLGEIVVFNALARSLRQAAQVAAALVIVDALNERAARLYSRVGFEPLLDDPDRLFLAMTTVAGYPLPDPDAPILL